jgi:hypothetical protein
MLFICNPNYRFVKNQIPLDFTGQVVLAYLTHVGCNKGHPTLE